MDIGIYQMQDDIMTGLFGAKLGGAIGWLLQGPSIYNGENSLDVLFEQRKESLFHKYNFEVKSYLNKNSEMLNDKIKKREFPPLIRVYIKID